MKPAQFFLLRGGKEKSFLNIFTYNYQDLETDKLQEAIVGVRCSEWDLKLNIKTRSLGQGDNVRQFDSQSSSLVQVVAGQDLEA